MVNHRYVMISNLMCTACHTNAARSVRLCHDNVMYTHRHSVRNCLCLHIIIYSLYKNHNICLPLACSLCVLTHTQEQILKSKKTSINFNHDRSHVQPLLHQYLQRNDCSVLQLVHHRHHHHHCHHHHHHH